MSYIRSPYNPEELYIFGTETEVEVHQGPDLIGMLPIKVMEGLIKKYIKNNCPDNCEYKGAKIEEVWIVLDDDGSFLCEKDDLSTDEIMSGKSALRTKFSYEDWHVYMYDVTWYYIAHSNVK